MKKALALILALILCLALCACGGESAEEVAAAKALRTEQAFNDSKEAFMHVTNAYLATNEFSKDIYEAWFLGVNDRKNYDDASELDDFIDEMNIEGQYIKQAVANLVGADSFDSDDWELLPYMYNNVSYFSAWIDVIAEAYKCSGKADEISEQLIAAKDLMKALGDEFSDYEHYPVLKEYFTNTLAFFDFCRDPEGSFEQVKETFNDYRNNAREHFFDLNYVFGDSIGGMDEYVENNGEPDVLPTGSEA